MSHTVSRHVPDGSSRRRLNILLIVLVIVAAPLLLYLLRRATDEDSFARARIRMVDEQLIARGIANEDVIRALRRVPRHLFVPDILRLQAYADRPLPIGYGQTISQPYIVGLMTEVLHPRQGMKVLEIGTGSGYQAAVLAELGCRVFTIEIIADLARWGATNIEQAGYSTVTVRCGNGFKGWSEEAPFDAIIVTCAPEAIPPALTQQLAEGGRMVIPVGRQGHSQALTLISKRQGAIVTEEIIPVRFVPMVNE